MTIKRANFGTPEWREQAEGAIRERHGSAASIKMATVSAAIKADDDGKATRQFTARITSEQMDRDREVLIAEGMDATEFKKSPTIFWNHWYDQPIGKSLSIEKTDGAWLSKAQIAARPADFQGEFFPDFVWAMLSQGMISGVSVGFEPTEERRPSDQDKKRFGDTVANIISKWKLLEWSIAPLQSNVGAVVTAVQKGVLSRDAVALALPGVELPEATKKTIVISSRPQAAKMIVVPAPAIPVRPKRTAAEIGQAVARELKRRRGALYE